MALRVQAHARAYKETKSCSGGEICAKMHWKEQKQPEKKSESDEESAKEQSFSDFSWQYHALLDVDNHFVIFCALKSDQTPVTHLPVAQESSSERQAPQDG